MVADASGERALAFYENLLLYQYLFAASVTIASLSKTDEGAASFVDQLRLGWSRTSHFISERGNLDHESHRHLAVLSPTALAVPTLRWDLAPRALRERRSGIEDRLWKIFFEAAGLSELAALPAIGHGTLQRVWNICEQSSTPEA